MGPPGIKHSHGAALPVRGGDPLVSGLTPHDAALVRAEMDGLVARSHRLAACRRACEGISDEALAAGVVREMRMVAEKASLLPGCACRMAEWGYEVCLQCRAKAVLATLRLRS